MTWARWRGGNPLGPPRAVGVGQQSSEAALLVAATAAPDGGAVALPAGGDTVNRFARGDGQDDASALDLEERARGLASDALEAEEVAGGEGKGARFATAHGGSLSIGEVEALLHLQHSGCP